MKTETKQFKLACIIRGWTYTAFVSKKTGKVLQITAGCRVWRSFYEAKLHYRTGHWSNDVVRSHVDDGFNYTFADRLEAIHILHRLENLSIIYKARLDNRREAAKKKASR